MKHNWTIFQLPGCDIRKSMCENDSTVLKICVLNTINFYLSVLLG